MNLVTTILITIIASLVCGIIVFFYTHKHRNSFFIKKLRSMANDLPLFSIKENIEIRINDGQQVEHTITPIKSLYVVNRIDDKNFALVIENNEENQWLINFVNNAPNEEYKKLSMKLVMNNEEGKRFYPGTVTRLFPFKCLTLPWEKDPCYFILGGIWDEIPLRLAS